MKNHLKSCKKNPDNAESWPKDNGTTTTTTGTLWTADLDKVIEAIETYDGRNPDFQKLSKNFNKKGNNGNYYRRIVMNVLNFMGQANWEEDAR